ncbi:MAG: acyl carrier protein [Oscillospiraceae bacterium]|nr:acyl carrier protein [Oscillospiraceae bacterium]MDE6004184.1 acyl carrier protein [Oscillospiraceae bacterium]
MDFETIATIIADQFDMDIDRLSENTDIQEDLNATSMDIVELIVTIESTTDIKIPDEAVDSIRTIGDVVNYLLDHAEE